MKKILIIALVSIVAGCTSKQSGNNAATPAAPVATAQAQEITSPYPIQYSSRFVMDDPKNAESLLKLWQAYDNGTLNTIKDLFADTVEIQFADGMIVKGPRDSVVAGAQKARATFQSVRSSVDAIMAVKSTDKNEHWAMIWGMERDTKNGKTDSTYLQETWRFDSTGKANLMFQYAQKPPVPKKPQKK